MNLSSNMQLALNEVKTQAKKQLKSIKANSEIQESQRLKTQLKKLPINSIDEIKLKHCLTLVSQELGFTNWHHAHDVLSGSQVAISELDMGSVFYPKRADMFINEWFASYEQAKQTLTDANQKKWLLPYKNQFIVVKEDYINTFNLNHETAQLWQEVEYNMVESYNSANWDRLTAQIIKSRHTQ